MFVSVLCFPYVISNIQYKYAFCKTLQHLVTIDKMEHRPDNKFGENVFWVGASSPIKVDDALARRAVDAWYNEITDYNFNNPGFSMGTGHFTQVVWKSSKSVGCGCAPKDNSMYCTCNYDPPGNIAGQFEANVPTNSGRKSAFNITLGRMIFLTIFCTPKVIGSIFGSLA